jgi:hypothetical protein
MANTFTTVLGYMGTRVRQRLGVEGNLESLNDIFNFIQLDDRVATSGQPTVAQFSLVKEAGYTTVINLAPKSHENALGNEDEILERIGIRYIHLPVVLRTLRVKTLIDLSTRWSPVTMIASGCIVLPTCGFPRFFSNTVLSGLVGQRMRLKLIYTEFGSLER